MPHKNVKDKAKAKRFTEIISKRRMIGVGGRKPKRGSDRTRKAGR